MNDISLDDIQLVNLIAKHGSFARAAELLALPRPNVTRRIKQVEAFLGVVLFKRSTRQLTLTPEGQAFLQHSQLIESQWLTAVERMQSAHEKPRGSLSVCSLGLMNRLISGPYLSEFVRQYPDVDLTMTSSWEAPNAHKFDADLMFNIAPLDDKSFINEAVAVSKRDFYASPTYLARSGVPKHPLDLEQFTLVLHRYRSLSTDWKWLDGTEEHPLNISSRLKFDQVEAALEMTLLDHGIAWLPDFLCASYVQRGELVQLFDGRYGTDVTLWAIYPRTPYDSNRIRLFIDMVRESGLLGTAVSKNR